MAVLLNILTLGETDEYYETAEIEALDTACRGSGGVPQLQKYPRTGAYRGSSRLFQYSHYSFLDCSFLTCILTS